MLKTNNINIFIFMFIQWNKHSTSEIIIEGFLRKNFKNFNTTNNLEKIYMIQ